MTSPTPPRGPPVAASIVEAIGNTPMVRMGRLNDTRATILMKMEGMNPVASVKDRLAMGIILKAEADGIITPGKSVLVEATSGNTGIALAALTAVRGYQLIAVMPESMSQERRALLALFGARVVLTPQSLGMNGAVAYAKKIVNETPHAVGTEQFRTRYNAEVHFETTGPEVFSQTNGGVDVFVAGVGTGGTITGVARYLRSVGCTARVVAVEPAESPVLSGGKAGPHKIQGLGAGFVPEVLDRSVIDEIVTVGSDEAIATSRQLPLFEGVFAGISAGANVRAALRIAARPESEGKTIVVIIPSFGERYLSTVLYQNVKEQVAVLPVVPLEEVKALLA